MQLARSVRAAIATVVVGGAVILAGLSSEAPAVAAGAKPSCGEARMFGHAFDVRVGGRPVSCRLALKVIDAPCKIRLKHDWSCFSFREADPFIVWFPSDEMFERDWSTAIIFKRYPCSEAQVTHKLFVREPRGFPSLRQLLADDLIRCRLLDGMAFQRVEELLGPGDVGGDKRYLAYDLGPERDSFFQVDNEYLSVGFSKSGRVSSVYIFQG